MTTPNGPVLFNNSTGSDTQASGLGPSTAVFGSGASTTGSSAVVTGIDTTGVTAGDLLWVQSSSGRQFSIIASVDSGSQVTCDDTFANTESSRTWAIGGKRASIGSATSRKIMGSGSVGDAKYGWILQLESGHTETISSNYRITVNLGSTSDGPFILRGDPEAAVMPLITANFNGPLFEPRQFDGFRVENIAAINTNTTKTSSSFLRATFDSRFGLVKNCRIGNVSDPFFIGFDLQLPGWGSERTKIIGSEIGISTSSGVRVVGCVLSGCTKGVAVVTFSGPPTVCDCVFDSCGTGVSIESQGGAHTLFGTIKGNSFYNTAGDGIVITEDSVRSLSAILVAENILSDIGGYGVRIDSATSSKADYYGAVMRNNAFYANTSGRTLNTPDEIDSVILTADPFVDAANGDFNLNDTAGGGALLRSATFDLP